MIICMSCNLISPYLALQTLALFIFRITLKKIKTRVNTHARNVILDLQKAFHTVNSKPQNFNFQIKSDGCRPGGIEMV